MDTALEPLLTVPAAATYLAVSESTVYRLAARGDLPAVRVGRQLRFRLEELAAFTGPAPVPSGTGSFASRLSHLDPYAA